MSDIRNRQNVKKAKGKNKPKGLNNANQTARVRPRIYHGHFLIQHPTVQVQTRKARKKVLGNKRKDKNATRTQFHHGRAVVKRAL
jgi:hypothetical protein